jgi:site-specific recombinase XerD
MDQMKLIEAFAADLKMADRSPDTVGQYPRHVKRLLDFCQKRNVDLLAVDKNILIKYLEDLRDPNRNEMINIVSIRQYFSALSTFFDFLVFHEYITTNPITPAFKRHYFREYKDHDATQRRKTIDITQAKILLHGIFDKRDRCVVCLLLKTGMRRKEVSELDVASVDLPKLTIHISPTGKRSGEIVFIDDEMAFVFRQWLKDRKKMDTKGSPAMFLNRSGNRLSLNAINNLFRKYATAAGLNNPLSDRLEDKFSPHACRHFFGTTMRKAHMQREFIARLRGDHLPTMDLYDHVDPEELKEAYLACVPQFGLL